MIVKSRRDGAHSNNQTGPDASRVCGSANPAIKTSSQSRWSNKQQSGNTQNRQQPKPD